MSRPVHFGYNPPSGQRGLETVDPATYVADLERMLAVIGPAIDSLWIADHFMTEERFRLECWTLLAWVASRHPGISIGPIVAAVGYRQPALFAKMVASLDALMASSAAASGIPAGRPILGIGAGWAEDEYIGYGFDFPRAGARIDQLEEAIELTKLLWTGGPVSYEGRWFRLVEATCVPAPDPPPIVLIGGEGPKTMGVAARHADWWNTLHRRPERLRETLERLAALCEEAGREPASLRRTMSITVFLDRDTDVARRRAGERLESDAPPFAGEPAELVDHLGELTEQGIDAFQLVFPGWPSTEDLELFVEHVRPAFPRD